jgi:sensor histidine kinase regulating citrate/malate metabolism
VVLIGLAIALALIFLIVVAGILMERQRRRREGYVPMQIDKHSNMSRIPPEKLFGNLNGDKQDTPQV